MLRGFSIETTGELWETVVVEVRSRLVLVEYAARPREIF